MNHLYLNVASILPIFFFGVALIFISLSHGLEFFKISYWTWQSVVFNLGMGVIVCAAFVIVLWPNHSEPYVMFSSNNIVYSAPFGDSVETVKLPLAINEGAIFTTSQRKSFDNWIPRDTNAVAILASKDVSNFGISMTYNFKLISKDEFTYYKTIGVPYAEY